MWVKLIMDDDLKVRMRMKKVKRRYSASPTPVLLRITGSLFTMLLLLWTICCGYQLTMEPWRYTAMAARAFHVGITTMAFGFLFVMVGISILANLWFNISDKLPELSAINQGQTTRTASKTIAKAIVAVITMLMILWAMYTAFKLATETGNSRHHLLTVSIGVTNILFGLIYFIIGLTIVLDLAIDFCTQMQQNERKNIGFHHNCSLEFKCPP